jgi:hypothetical protein
VTSTKRTDRPARKKYVPSEKQRAADDALRKRLENVTEAEMRKFDKALEKAITTSNKKSPGP